MKYLNKLLLLLACFLFLNSSIIAQGGSGGAGGGDAPTPQPQQPDQIDEPDEPIEPQEDYIDEDWQFFDNSLYYFSCPEDWELDESGINGTAFFVSSPSEKNFDTFTENLNLVLQNLSDYGIQADLEEYVELSIMQLPTMFKNFELISSEKKHQNGRDFYEIQYKGRYLGFNMQWKQRVWVRNNIAYVLSFTALQKTMSTYDDISTQMMDTFKLK